ncbi:MULTISPECIES: peptidoglycan editing factor PgeF [unclassified Pseudoalteromonas]|uniref:peptidoglycan editing factor PgeF n=1 Tax=unclassified Pseudoalteromonas TaxID=194690 RepID=UPI0005AAA579|nr:MULTISPECIES: peptidoglycan editing factor PgeF [unclassified Pseudoalteromonas]
MACISTAWITPKNIKSFTTTRKGGVSKPPFDSFNIAYHVNDNPNDILTNRALLHEQLPCSAVWLEQIHSNKVIEVNSKTDLNIVEQADALFTKEKNIPLAIMTADCLPILLTDEKGSQIAAIHGGWRGLAGGIINNTVACFDCNPSDIKAWLGPAIGPERFEVGQDVIDAFSKLNINHLLGFKPQKNGKFLADIFVLAQQLLIQLGISHISSEQRCTYDDPELFYSYRRDNQTGRMASLIWIEN